jgi:hypothetical protein
MQTCLVALWFSIACSWLATIIAWGSYLFIIFYDTKATINIFGYEIYLQVIVMIFAIIATFYAALFSAIWAGYEELSVRLRQRLKIRRRISPVVITHHNASANVQPSIQTTQFPQMQSILPTVEQQPSIIYPNYGTMRNASQQVMYPSVYYNL